MIALKAGLYLWAVAGPALAGGVVYVGMVARETIVVSGAVTAARNDEVSKCSEQRLEITRKINESVAEGVSIALAAATAEMPTPTEQQAINALCKASSSCRDREEMP